MKFQFELLSSQEVNSPQIAFSWKANLQSLKFLPSPLQQNTLGVGPTAADHTITSTHLTVKSIN